MIVATSRVILAGVAASALLACGGGGGDAGGPVIAPPPPPETVALAITASNAKDAVTLPAAAGAATLQLGEMVADVARLTATKSSSSFGEPCPSGGSVDVVLTDTDQNRRPTSGDTLRATFRNCYAIALDDIVNGEVNFVLEAPASGADEAYSGTATFSSGFSVGATGAQETVEVAGAIRIEWRLETLQTILRVTAAAQDNLQLIGVAQATRLVERVRAPQLSKTLRYDFARHVIRIGLTYESQALRGRVDLSTSQDITGYLNVYPDQGRFLAAGSAGRQVELAVISSGGVPSGTSEGRLRADIDGNGSFEVDTFASWSEVTDGYLWWEPISRPDIRSAGYETQLLSQTGFGFLFTKPDSPISVQPQIVIQLTRELESATAVQLTFVGPTDGVAARIPTTTTINGARVIVAPLQQLEHGRTYLLDIVSGAFRDRTGTTLTFFLTPVQTRNNLVADATASTQLVIGTTPFTLDASRSAATTGAIRSYRWRQTAGTPAVIASDASAVTTVTPAIPNNGADVLRFELEVTNDAGESDRVSVDVQSFANAAQVAIVYYRSSPDDRVGGGRTALLTSASGEIRVTRNPDNGITAGYGSFNPGPLGQFVSAILDIAAPDGAQLEVGVFENARRYPFQVPGEPGLQFSVFPGGGCNQVGGRFEVFEIAYDPTGAVTSLAVDFEHRCEILGPPLFGSIRFNSTRPLRL
jgi:hypothetical protein